MASPYVTIDIDKIEHNARAIVDLCRGHGIAVTGVTKGVCGHPEIAMAMLRGGVESLGESRMENVHRLREAGVDAPCMMLRVPSLTEAMDVVASTDISLNSEHSVLAALSDAASRSGERHDIILMVDLGDLREGVWPSEIVSFVQAAVRLPGIRLAGLGTNLACYGGVIPTEANMNRLVHLVGEVEDATASKIEQVSGINSSGLELLAAGLMPERINHGRIGEAILLGRETIRRKAWPGTVQDAFVLHAEVLECKTKPSIPIGERGEDAFGGHPAFEDRGDRVRALLNIGREDVDVEGLVPVDESNIVLGATSEYLIVDVTDASAHIEIGAELAFHLKYGALLAVMTSPYVEKRSIDGGHDRGARLHHAMN